MKLTALLAFACLSLAIPLPDAAPDAIPVRTADAGPETFPDAFNATASGIEARQGAPCLLKAHWDGDWSEAGWHRFRVRVDASGRTAGGLGTRQMLDEWIMMFDFYTTQHPFPGAIHNPGRWHHSNTIAYGDVSVWFNDLGYINYKNFHQSIVNGFRSKHKCDIDSRW
ncbi:hypothetical protein QBC34DRAFT_380114 [Podospora aff. communis PSN243]|uniref:Tyrosinase copper-binding domain-containing protein n=1 Tax=Podospora aff. communis PSN243 TaxID=3040156 RepID=A0AAV9GPR2_9PEZI|nr:hypothetical protein QBC34DRAFT_380114 [Podospora aff. communis PSN243]